MNRQQTFYFIYTAQDMDKERLQNWKIPRIEEDRRINKKELIKIITTELEKGNFTGAIDIIKKSFNQLNMVLPEEINYSEFGNISKTGAHQENQLISAVLSSMEMFPEDGTFIDETKI